MNITREEAEELRREMMEEHRRDQQHEMDMGDYEKFYEYYENEIVKLREHYYEVFKVFESYGHEEYLQEEVVG